MKKLLILVELRFGYGGAILNQKRLVMVNATPDEDSNSVLKHATDISVAWASKNRSHLDLLAVVPYETLTDDLLKNDDGILKSGHYPSINPLEYGLFIRHELGKNPNALIDDLYVIYMEQEKNRIIGNCTN